MSSCGVATVCALVAVFVLWLWVFSPGPRDEVGAWLDENELASLRDHPEVKG